MKTSARNRFTGTVKNIVEGPVSAEVTVSVAPGIDVIAASARRRRTMSDSPSASQTQALIKAGSVLAAVD